MRRVNEDHSQHMQCAPTARSLRTLPTRLVHPRWPARSPAASQGIAARHDQHSHQWRRCAHAAGLDGPCHAAWPSNGELSAARARDGSSRAPAISAAAHRLSMLALPLPPSPSLPLPPRLLQSASSHTQSNPRLASALVPMLRHQRCPPTRCTLATVRPSIHGPYPSPTCPVDLPSRAPVRVPLHHSPHRGRPHSGRSPSLCPTSRPPRGRP